jgi:hypothetical protein
VVFGWLALIVVAYAISQLLGLTLLAGITLPSEGPRREARQIGRHDRCCAAPARSLPCDPK